MLKVFPRHSVTLSKEAFAIPLRALTSRAGRDKNNMEEFEEAFAKYLGAKYAFSFSSGRVALGMILDALNLKKGTEVIVSDYNFPPIPLLLKQYGLRPVFVDIHPEFHNLDVSLIEEKITPQTGAILVTHLFGQPCQMDAVLGIARSRGIKVIEDCAHACGSEYKGTKVGCFGDAGFFSFGPGKSLACFGGGVAVTDDDSMARELKKLSSRLPLFPSLKVWKNIIKTFLFYVATRKNVFPYTLYPVICLLSLFDPDFMDRLQEEKVDSSLLPVANKYRMTDVQAEVGLSQLKHLDANNERRIRNARLLDEILKSIKGVELVKTIPGAKNIYLYYRIMVGGIDGFRKELLRRGVDTERDDMHSCSGLPVFKEDRQECPVARQVYDKSLEIPCNSFMTEEDILYIGGQIKEIAAGKNENESQECTANRITD